MFGKKCRYCDRPIPALKSVRGVEFCSVAHAVAFRKQEREQSDGRGPLVIDVNANPSPEESAGQTLRLWPSRTGRLRYRLKTLDTGSKHSFSIRLGELRSLKGWSHTRVKLVVRLRKPMRLWRWPRVRTRVVLKLRSSPRWVPVLKRLMIL
jgi:hypothetical protein